MVYDVSATFLLTIFLFGSDAMTIEEAVTELEKHLGDPEVFQIRHDGTRIVVDVTFIYRVKEVTDLGGVWQGYPVSTGRRSCW